jgi:hypothetical protein
MNPVDPQAAQRSMNARLAALTRHAQSDAREATAPARAGLLKRFLDEVDPERVLPEDERARRAERARKVFYLRLAKKSAAARALRKSSAAAD